MLISTHVLSGAVLGRALGHPLPALVLGVGSHLALDSLPHWGRGLGYPPPAELDEETFRVARRDGLAGLALIAAVAAVVPAAQRPQVLAGIVGACLPDMDKPGRRWLGGSPWPQRFDRLHSELQRGVEQPHLLRQDVTIAAVAAVAVLALLRRG